MVKKSKKNGAENKSERINILDKLKADDALAILKILAAGDEDIAKRIEEIAMEHLREVDVEGVASDVYFS